jgi:L-lactate dehydrogenase (cytochrome)
MVAPKLEPSATSDDVAWVGEHFNGRLVVRVVLDPEDARRSVDGVYGIVVSNHGGRQLDSVRSTVRALPT